MIRELVTTGSEVMSAEFKKGNKMADLIEEVALQPCTKKYIYINTSMYISNQVFNIIIINKYINLK